MKVLVLKEGKYQGQTGYHFTNIFRALGIIQSDLMKATNPPTPKGMFKDLNKGVRSWSITREQHGFAYRNFEESPIRFDIDLWKLSNNQKIKGAYVDSPSYAPTTDEFEYEMRPIGDTKNFHKFVKSIAICLDTYSSLKKEVEQSLMAEKTLDSKIMKEVEAKVKSDFSFLFEVLNISEDEKSFKDILIEDINKTIGDGFIEFRDYVKSNSFKFNYTEIIKDCNSAIKMIESSLAQNVSGDIKNDSKLSKKIIDIILNNNKGQYADILKFLSTDSKWKDIPIIFVDKKGVKLSFRYRKGISVDNIELDIYKKLIELDFRYKLVLRKYIWQYLEQKKGISLLKEINPDDSFVRLYDGNTDKGVYVPALDKDDIKEIKLILRKGKHSGFEFDGNKLYSSSDIIARELLSVFKFYSTLKKQTLFYVAESLNLKKFLAFSIAPDKDNSVGIIPYVLSTKNKKV